MFCGKRKRDRGKDPSHKHEEAKPSIARVSASLFSYSFFILNITSVTFIDFYGRYNANFAYRSTNKCSITFLYFLEIEINTCSLLSSLCCNNLKPNTNLWPFWATNIVHTVLSTGNLLRRRRMQFTSVTLFRWPVPYLIAFHSFWFPWWLYRMFCTCSLQTIEFYGFFLSQSLLLFIPPWIISYLFSYVASSSSNHCCVWDQSMFVMHQQDRSHLIFYWNVLCVFVMSHFVYSLLHLLFICIWFVLFKCRFIFHHLYLLSVLIPHSFVRGVCTYHSCLCWRAQFGKKGKSLLVYAQWRYNL